MSVDSVKLQCIMWQVHDDRRHDCPTFIGRVDIRTGEVDAACRDITESLFYCRCHDGKYLRHDGKREQLAMWPGQLVPATRSPEYDACLFPSLEEILVILAEQRRIAVTEYELDDNATTGG